MIHDQRNLDVFQLHHDFTLIFFTHGTQGAPNLQNPSKKKKKNIFWLVVYQPILKNDGVKVNGKDDIP